MIRILICEDEELISNRLMRFIKEVVAAPVHIDRVYTFREAQTYLENRNTDLLFLDLNLHGRDGYELLRSFVAGSFHTIVVSAYTDRAIEAFEHGVMDFVGKPFKKERIAKALNRYVEGIPPQERNVKRLALKGKKGLGFVAIENIKFIQAAGIYAELHLFDGTKKLYDKPLNQLIKILPEVFFRVHKSYVANMAEVRSVRKIKPNSFELVLSSGETIPLSRNRKKEILELLSRH
ncbi:LytR/AlgR family response regulator transcription factor [Sinomicrobium weinanense]|uniref:Response regulator transcription factor n=1 Tax=Sinomicrobium weinanense TaxID=2842200 RepID=A0A926Q1Q7_9FLAO|nr:LytTR family DNA-binding domain-containing protein [Sinomicrobium weinanense]MBC9795039.1 response regulator transcription factor [Sinomicrobium weinanense]MBU3123832.1 LytTR family DNA-binding domain-containing protein [Sinomicrobium weinanense]